MFEDPIVSLFTTSIAQSESAMTKFVDRVSSAYGLGSGTPNNPAQLYPPIERQAQIGSYGINGSVEPMSAQRDLNYKLQALDLTSNLNIQALRPDTYSFAQSIYGGMGIEPPATQTFGGDYAGGSAFRMGALSDRYTNNPMPTATALGGGSTNNLIGTSGLEGSMMRLKDTLSADYGIKIEINRITPLEGGSSSPTQLSVTVPNIEINYDGSTLSQSGGRDLLRSSSKTFQFTTTEMGGVIELKSNRYIGGSLVNTVNNGTIRQDSFQTTAGYIATYVLQQQVILDQGTSLAFKQFLTNQQVLNPTQNYFELDKFLGRALGQELPFSQYVKSISNTATAKDFLDLQSTLGKKLGIGLGTERFSQVSSQELATLQTTAIARILQPLGQAPDKSSVSDRVIKNLARELLNPQTVKNEENRTVRVDAFTQLKMQILMESGAGNSILQNQIRAMLKQELSTGRKNLLDQLRSPFLQPHESNYSGAQQMGKLAYYAEDRSLLTASDGRSSLLQLGGVYAHGGTGVPTGEVFATVSSTSSRNKIYDSQFHDSQLELTGKDTASFFDIQTLFTGSRQLNTTTLADLASTLGNYKDKDQWLTQLQQQLNIADAQSQILLTPYRKAEQIPQRLKNLTGTRPAIEYSLDFYRDIMAQKDVSKYYARNQAGEVTHLDRGLAVSANLNTVLPQIQFERAAAMAKTSSDLTGDLRRIEANPLADVRGFVTSSKLKRVGISTGANQASDFMQLNAAHESYAGYEQYTKIELQSIQSYDAPGGTLYAQNIAIDMQRDLLQRAFEPGRSIYYSDTKLQHEKTINHLSSAYNQILADYAGVPPDSISPADRTNLLANRDLRSLVSSGLKQRFNFIRSVEYNKETQSLDFTLKSGLYGQEKGNFHNYGLFDRESSQLVLGLAPQVDQNGEFTLSKQMTVKISGVLRKDQNGVAITNDLLQFNKIDGRLFGHASYTILFEGPVRPGVENVKGPGVVNTSEIFDYHDKQLAGINYTGSERTLTDNPIYAIMSSASLKGYSYESGLDVLSTNKSTGLFIERLRRSGTTSTALFATYFASNLSELLPSSASAADRQRLTNLSRDLQSAIKTNLSNSSEYDIHIQRAVDSLGNEHSLRKKDASGKDIPEVKSLGTLTKNANLFINNAGLFDLLDRNAHSMGLGVDAPLAQLQQTLLHSLTSGNDEFLQRVIKLFSNATQESFEERQHRTYNQNDPRVRAAAVVSQMLGSSYQVLDYGRARAGNDPLTKSILELNLVDHTTGRLNAETLFGAHHDATIDMLTKAKVQVPREETLTKMRATYLDAMSHGREYAPDRAHEKEYRSFASEILNLYASSQTAIPVMIGLTISPSKILQAAGSKDSANLELHYSMVMSKTQIDKMRGYVSAPNELTEVAAAYRLLVNFTQNKTLGSLKFISPFTGSSAVENYRTVIKSLEHAGSLAHDLNYFGADRNQTLFSQYAHAAVSQNVGEMERIITGMKVIDSTARFYTGPVESKEREQASALNIKQDPNSINQSDKSQVRKRAIALSTATDTRRGELKQQTARVGTTNSKFVFFDIETSGLVDERYPAGDSRRSPTQSVSEIAFIFGEHANARTIVWKQGEQGGEFKTRSAALAEVGRLLAGEFKDAALVGHNIRAFDIPTLNPLMGNHTLYGSEVYDTLTDVDRIKVKAELGTSKFSQTAAYKRVIQRQLIEMGNNPAAQEALASGDYGEYDAHKADVDVRANIELFKFLRDRKLFKQGRTPIELSNVGRGYLFKEGSITYFDAAPGSSSRLYKTARELATTVYREAGRSHLGYHLNANHDMYNDRFRAAGIAAGLDGDLVSHYTEQLLFKSMNQAGRLALGKGVEATDINLRIHFDTHARESDLKVERAIKTSLLSSEASYIDNIGRQGLAYRDREVNLRIQGDTKGADRARKLAMTLHETRVLVMPHLNIVPNINGNFDVRFVEANPEKDGSRRALLGSSLIYLGSDILTQLPKEFGDFVPKIIRHRRNIDRLLPEYLEIIEGVQTGNNQLTSRQHQIILDLQTISAENTGLIYESLGGAMGQRAFGEKTKTRGVSGTTVASYLLHADEVGLGTRFSNALSQDALRRLAKLQGFEHGPDEVLVLRAGGPAGASQVDQTYRVTSMQQLADRADTMGTYAKVDPKRNHTTSIIPIFGRFATQGGDFDGDSYGIIGRYDKSLTDYVDLLEQGKQLKSTAYSFSKAINSSQDVYIENFTKRKYDMLLSRELQIAADKEAHQISIKAQLDRANRTGEVAADGMLKSIWHLVGKRDEHSRSEFFDRLRSKFDGVRQSIISGASETSFDRARAALETFGILNPDSTLDRITKAFVKSKDYKTYAAELSPFTQALEVLERRKSTTSTPQSRSVPEMISLADSIIATLDPAQEHSAKLIESIEYLKAGVKGRVAGGGLTTSLLTKRVEAQQSEFIKVSNDLSTPTGVAVFEKLNQTQSEFIATGYADGVERKYKDRVSIAMAAKLDRDGKLTPHPGGVVDFVRGMKTKSTEELEPEAVRILGAARVAELRAQASGEASASYERGFNENRLGALPANEVAFLQSQLQGVATQQKILKGEIAAKKIAVDQLLTQTGDIAERSVASVRRHVAAYTGLPTAYLAKESSMFTDAQVFNAVEQHRGVTPGLEDLESSVVRDSDFNLRLNQTLSQIHEDYIRPSAEIQGYLKAHEELKSSNLKMSVSLFDKQGMMGLRGQFAKEYLAGVGANVEAQVAAVADVDVRTSINRAVEAVGMPAYLGYTADERFNKTLEFGIKTNPVGQSLATVAKLMANAGGTSLSAESFTALSDTITSMGTSLIGEAYNSITLLMGRTMMARSLSEALHEQLPFSTGIDSSDSSGKFLKTTKAAFKRTLAQNTSWQGTPRSSKLDEARDLLSQVFDNPAPLAAAAYNRAQHLTGLLANVQQSIRDSLKQKVDGGLLQSIMSEPVVGTNSIYQILTSSTSTNEERLPALRKFIAEDAGAAIFTLPGERTYADRYKVTAFGALFLLKDFLSVENQTQAEKMLGINVTQEPKENQVVKYKFLQERYEQLSAQATSTNSPKLNAMLESPQTFIAQSVIDLINMSTAERTVYQTMFKGDNADQHLGQMIKIREATMKIFGSTGAYGFTKEALALSHEEFFSEGTARTTYHEDIARSLFFDPTNGKDLLKTDLERVDAARSLGLTQVTDRESFNKNEFEFYQRATTNFIYTRNQKYGLQVGDLKEMQETHQALHYLRFESIAGNTIFKNFTMASASAIEALTIASTRSQIDDPAQMAAVSYEAGSQMVAALGEVHKQFTETYGNLHFDRKNTGVPQETLRAYHAAQSLSGVFNQLFNSRTTDPDVLKHVTEMFSLSLASKDKEGNSGWTELSHFLGGMAQRSKTLDLLMYVPEAHRNPEIDEMHKSFSEAIDRDTAAGVPKNHMGTHQVQFVTELGRVHAAENAPTIVITSPAEQAKQISKHARTSLISAFIGPALMTMLASSKGDDNLTMHGLGLVQAIAQVSEIHNPRKMSAATLYQVDRIQNTIKEDGAIIGGVRAVTSEIMFEAASRFAHQALGSNRGSPVRNYIAEVGIAALSLAIASLGGDRKAGALGVGEDQSQLQALISLPGIGIGIAESAIDEFMRSNTVESDFDSQIEYEVTLETRNSNVKDAFLTGWLKQDQEEEGGIDERADGSAMAYNVEDYAST